MTRATLSDVLTPALRDGHAVAGLVVLGWEDARAYVDAAEAEQMPVILQAGPGFRAHMPLPVIAAMFTHLADQAEVPIVVHLDHSRSIEECRQALDLGFSSVMYDGSSKPLNQNIDETAQVVELTRRYTASCEGEIGFVGYAEGEKGSVTDPEDASRFAAQTGVDAMAISVGNVHLQTEKAADIDLWAIRAIEDLTSVPLVLHGGSGIPLDIRLHLARDTHVCKFNIGTELRMAFGTALRATLDEHPHAFDRLTIMNGTYEAVVNATREIIRPLAYPDRGRNS